jgi:xanthine dehydrogenase YagR molybdenum-binding subunit
VLTVHDSTRWIIGERKALAAYLDMPDDKIRILSPLVGGAFGSKSFLWMHVVLCAVAARVVQRPVKVVLTRDQMFSSTGHRPRTEQDLVSTCQGSVKTFRTIPDSTVSGNINNPCRRATAAVRRPISGRAAPISTPRICRLATPSFRYPARRPPPDSIYRSSAGQ